MHIEVRFDNGIITLTGHVPSLVTSVRASEVACRVPGVRAGRIEPTLEGKGHRAAAAKGAGK